MTILASTQPLMLTRRRLCANSRMRTRATTWFLTAQVCRKPHLSSYSYGLTDDFSHADGRIALVTENRGRHKLSFFDVARDDGHVTSRIELRPPTIFAGSEQKKLEINDATFSPDGNLLALARNDNVTDIYDTRFLDRVWATLPHTRSSMTSLPVEETYGVFGAHWVQGRDWGSLGLVTGGADGQSLFSLNDIILTSAFLVWIGCIRLWDVLRAPSEASESTVLAELNHDVAHFIIGDPYKGEKRLVA